MQKLLILVLAVLVGVQGQISITLQPHNVVGANGVITDVVYTYTTVDDVKVIFDTRALQNYQVVNGTCTGTSFPLLGTACSGTSGAVTTQAININGQSSQKLSWQQVSLSTGASALVNLGVGLQIPVSQLEQYFQNRLSSTFRTQTQSFSFLFNPVINKVFFGQQQNYLNNNLVSFPVLWGSTTNQWVLTVSSFSRVGGNGAFAAATVNTAVFDSTTSKILVPANVLTDVLSKVENLGSISNAEKCQLVQAAKTQLAFVFAGNPSKNNNFIVNLNDLIQTQADGSCTLLLQQTTAAYNNQWVLGTSFLKNVYTYFNYDSHTISLGNVNPHLTIDPVVPSNSWSTVFIITGILLTLASLFALVTLIKPITNVTPTLTNQAKPKPNNNTFVSQTQFQPQLYQPQYIQSVQPQQRFVVYQQPAVNQTISNSIIRQSSPTRVIPQQQVVRQ